MKTIKPGEIATELLRAGKQLNVSVSDGSAIVEIFYAAELVDSAAINAEPSVFGPYDSDVNVKISSIAGVVQYFISIASFVEPESINSQIGTRAGYVCIGDSILANGLQTDTIVSLTAVGTTVTCTLASGSIAHEGMRIHIGRVNQAEYAGFHVITARISAAVFTYEVPVAPTVSSATFEGTGVYSVQSKLNDVNIPEIANLLSGQKMKYLGNFAIGGARLAAITNTVNEAALPTNNMYSQAPEIAFVNGGINDVISGRTYEQIKTDYIALVAALSKIFGKVVFIPLLTVNNSASSALITKINFWLRSYLADFPGYFVTNSDRIVIDPASTAGNYRLGYTIDGVHPSNTACYFIAKDINDTYLAALPQFNNKQSVSLKSLYSVDATTPQLADNPTMQGNTGVTAGVGVSGTIPDNYKVRSAGGGSQTVVCSTPASTNGPGNDLQCILTAAAKNDGFHILIDSPADITSRLTIGDKIYAALTVEVVGATAALRAVELKLQHTVGGFTGQDTAIAASGSNMDLNVSGFKYRMQTPIYEFQGSETFTGVIFLATMNAAGSMTVRVTDFDIINTSKI